MEKHAGTFCQICHLFSYVYGTMLTFVYYEVFPSFTVPAGCRLPEASPNTHRANFRQDPDFSPQFARERSHEFVAFSSCLALKTVWATPRHNVACGGWGSEDGNQQSPASCKSFSLFLLVAHRKQPTAQPALAAAAKGCRCQLETLSLDTREAFSLSASVCSVCRPCHWSIF